MEDALNQEAQSVLAGSPAVISQTAKTIKAPQHDVLPATNIRTHDPMWVEQVNPEDESGLIDFSTGYKSDGQGNLAGVAGARRPVTGERGDPFFLDPVERYKEVIPFDMYLPALGKYAKLNTTQPDKAAWQMMVFTNEVPDYDYLGYYRMRPYPEQGFWGGLTRSAIAGTGKLGVSMARSVTTLPAEEGIAFAAGDELDSDAKESLSQINDWWNARYEAIDKFVGTDYAPLSRSAEWGAGIGNAAATLAMLYLAKQSAPFAIAALNMGSSAPRILYDSMESGVSPRGAVLRSVGGGAAITASDILPLLGTRLLGRARETAVAELIKKPTLLGALGTANKRAAGEVVTTWFQNEFEDRMANQPWDDATLDSRLIMAITSGMTHYINGIPEYAGANRQRKMELLRIAEGSQASIDAQNRTVEVLRPLVEEGVLTADEVKEYARLVTSPEAISFVGDRVQSAILGAADKVTPEELTRLQDLIKKMQGEGVELSEKTFNQIDASVKKAVNDGGFADADVPLYQALFRGLTAIKLYNKGEMLTESDIGKFFSMEDLGAPDRAGVYNPATNATGIRRVPPKGTSAYDAFVRPDVPGSELTSRVRTILHEFSHKIDEIAGEVGVAEFMADYIESISEVFGKEHASKVQEGVGRPKGARKVSYADKSEWRAEAIERLGVAAAKYLGLKGSRAQQYISLANMMINGLKDAGAADAGLLAYQAEMVAIMEANAKRFAEIADYYGRAELANKIKLYLDDQAATPESVGLSYKDVSDMNKIVKSFLNEAGINSLREVIDLDSVESFVDKTDRLFAEGLELANKESERLLAQEEGTAKQDGLALTRGSEEEPFFAGIREESLTDDELQTRRVEGYHATPEMQFDKPSTSMIGSGEGAASHGWGIYFLANKGLDKLKYWSNLALRKGTMPLDVVVEFADGSTKRVPVLDVGQDLLLELGRFNVYSPEDVLWFDGHKILEPDSSIISAANDAESSLWESFLGATVRQAGIDEAGAKQFTLSVDKSKGFGQMQKALLPDDGELLYENKPLSSQPAAVQAAVKKTAEENGIDYKSEATGRDFYNELTSVAGSKEAASKALLSNGVKGIEYIGRSDGKGWVVFDEDAIDVIDTVRGTEGIVQYSKVDPLSQYSLMPATPSKNQMAKVHKQTFGEWYQANNVDAVIANTTSAIEKQSSLRTRFPKFAKFWGKMTAGNVMATLDWVGGEDLVKQFDLVNAERIWNNERFAIQESMQNKAMEQMKKTVLGMEAFYNDMARGRVDMVDSDGKVRTLNGFEMMDVWLNNDQPFAKKRNELAFKDGQAGVDAVIAQMTPEMIQYATLMRETIADLREEYQKVLGMRFHDWENYFPIADRRGQLLSKNRVFSNYTRDFGAQGELQIRDAREMFNMYVNRVAMAKSGYYKQLTLLKSMLTGVPEKFSQIEGDEVALAAKLEEGNIKINQLLQDALGEDGALKLLDSIDTLMRSPTQDIVMFNKGVLGKAVANARISRLVWAPISWAKNATNIFLQANADPDGSASYWQGMANALSNPVEAWKFMMQFPTIRNRLKGITVDEFLQATNVSPSMLTDLANMINSGKSTPSKVMAQMAAITKTANKTGQAFMLYGDAFGNVFGLYGYATKLMDQYNGNIDMVDRALNDHIVRTQSSTMRSVKSSFHRKLLSLPIVGGLASFTGDPVQKFNTISQNIAQAIVGEKTFGEASRKVLPIVMSTIAFILVSVGIGDLWDDNPENDEEVYNALNNELISQSLSFTPLSGVLAPTVKRLFGMQDAGMNTPFTSMMNDTASAINKGKWEDVALNTATMFGGVYVDRFANTVDGFGDVLLGPTEEDRAVGVRKALGRTERFSEKRVRPSKKKVDNKQ